MNKDEFWDVSDFLSRYTTKSTTSPIVKVNEVSNHSTVDLFNVEDVFCTSQNLDERLMYLNQELTSLGYLSIFKNNNLSSKNDIRENLDLAQLVNCTYELLKQQHQQLRTKDELEEKQMRSENDNEFLIQSQTRLKQDLENAKREVALSACRENEQTSKVRILLQEIKAERDEKRKMKSDLDHIKNQCHHELKRMEKETSRLQAKVHQLLNDKTQEKKVSIEVLNVLQRGDGKRSTWRTATSKRNEEDMYKLIISSYEEKEKILLLENQSVRELLQDILNMLLSINSSQTNEALEEDKQLCMPFHLVKNDIKKKFFTAIESIQAMSENKTNSAQGENNSAVSNATYNELHSKVENCEAIISAQEKLIQNLKDGNTQEALQKILMNFDTSINGLADNQAQEKVLQERNKSFIEEQKRFTDYVLKIEKEKEEFEKERVEFYMTCLSTPAVNRGLHGKVLKSESLRSAQPIFSPAPHSSKVNTPSTADLYKFMSLAYDREQPNSNTTDRSATHDGSFVSYDAQESPSVKKLQEHANNIRKAVEERHNKSADEEKRNLRMTFYIMILSLLVSSCSSEIAENVFVEENLDALEGNKFNCQSLEISFLLWLEKHKSSEHAIVCALKFVKDKNIKSKQPIWIFLHSIFTKEKQVTKASYALKQVKNKQTLTMSERWYFLGPFQIGKPEFDGNPAVGHGEDIAIDQRWDSTFHVYSELANKGILKWMQVLPQNGVIHLNVEVDWNNLISSLQSMAVTEWQGFLVNDFFLTKDSDVQAQCLGVSVFYINDIVINGDVYHRQEYWYPLSLPMGNHVIKVHVRAKVNAVVKCSIKILKQRSLVFHNVKFSPDLVAGNLFSPYVSILVSNKNPVKNLFIRSLTATCFGLSDLSAELFGNQEFYPGQFSNTVIKLSTSISKMHASCKKDVFKVGLLFKVSDGKEQEMALNLRCREVKQSFLFTFIDHDGSVQHAAAIQPLSPCLLQKCPVLLTLHGTGVSAQNQADSYKYMKNGKFVFGVDKLWLLAPTRHGAHNWEGPGELTALSAVKELSLLTSKSLGYFSKCANSDLIVFAGHSMGGHGAWQLSVHNPDLALAVISGAGWLSKEDYGDSNLFYHFDVSISYIDPAIKLIQEACINENHADKHAPNLKGLSVMIRIGADDKTVHPYFSRRMFRLLKANDVNVTYNEFQGKDHWWWDTKKPNDGGVTNDLQIRSYATQAVDNYERFQQTSECSYESCTQVYGKLKYTSVGERRNYGSFHFVVFNPASFNGGRGIYVIQQKFPMHKSEMKIEIRENEVYISTINILCIRITEPIIDPVVWQQKLIHIDGFKIQSTDQELPWFLCLHNETWQYCKGVGANERDISSYGPARRIAEKPFHISICDNENNEEMSVLLNSAIFLSNLFQSTSDTPVLIRKLKTLSDTALDNMILLGTENCTKNMELKKLINFTSNGLKIGECHFIKENLSALYLLPHKDRLILFLTAQSAESIRTYALRLSFPTIPPMTRSPFSNLVPDYLVFSPEILSKGPGGFLCAGFWSNTWGYDVKTSSCTC